MGGRRILGKRPRGPHRPILQKRDYLLLRALAKARVMRTRDMVPLIFPSVDMARRRIRKLSDGGYVASYTSEYHKDYRNTLERQGIRALNELPGYNLPVKTAPKTLRPPPEHDLALISFWSRFVYEIQKLRQIAKLTRFQFEWEETKGHIRTITRFRPDAEITFVYRGKEVPLHIEMDLDTESIPYIAEHKFGPFSRLSAGEERRLGRAPKSMLVLVPSERRLRSLTKIAAGVHAPIFGRVFPLGEGETSLLNEGWIDLRNGAAAPGSLFSCIDRQPNARKRA